jgi:hypothetical protein
METIIHSSKPPFDSTAINPDAISNKANYWLDDLCRLLSNRKNIKYACLSFAAIALMALPIGRRLIEQARAGIPIFASLIFSPPLQHQARVPVLAVDASGMTIHGKNISAAVKDRFETAAYRATRRIASALCKLDLRLTRGDRQHAAQTIRRRIRQGRANRTIEVPTHERRFCQRRTQRNAPMAFSLRREGAGRDYYSAALRSQRHGPRITVVQWERRTRAVDGKEKASAPTQVARVTLAVAAGAKAAQVEPTPVIANPPKVYQDVVTRAKVQPGPAQPFPMIKTTQAVALRQQPRFAAERIHEIDAETELSLLENKGDWLKVKVAHAGAIGFVRKEYITPLN